MACGCPVVSTDCPSGPDEILAGGRYGRLVPVGDDAALADAIAGTLDDRIDREALRKRAREFDVDSAVARYLEVLLH
jgi:glycosyltransferase involved in cell wall biosynthesis